VPTEKQTDTLTDRCKLSHAIRYSYGADKNHCA